MPVQAAQYTGTYTTSYTSLPPYSHPSSYPFSSPGAFLPPTAINLSVKTEDSAQTAELSPQILDLTRPLR